MRRRTGSLGRSRLAYDPYYLEQEWRGWWVDSGCIELQHPDKAFIAFCKKRYERKPNP